MESRFPEVVETQPELLAQQVVHAPSLAYAFAWAAQLHVYRQEAHAVQQWAEAMVALANEHGFALWVAFGTLLRGWALARQGQHTEGILQIHSGLSAWLATGTAISRPLGLTLLAEAYGMAGQIDKALATVTEALAAVDTSREFIWEANLHRLRGELLLVRARDQQAEAEACFQQARAVACRQQAKSLELRAATSLPRLWQGQGRRQDAYDLLAPVYAWFTEGFDTADLQEAKALLEELAV
jgi:predicted ATPase